MSEHRLMTLADVPVIVEAGPFAVIAHEGRTRLAAITSDAVYREGRRRGHLWAFQDLLEAALRNDPECGVR